MLEMYKVIPKIVRQINKTYSHETTKRFQQKIAEIFLLEEHYNKCVIYFSLKTHS